MFQPFPISKFTMGVLATAWFLPLAMIVDTKYIRPTAAWKTAEFEEGKKVGYEKAKREVNEAAARAVRRTMEYIDEDIRSVETGKVVPPVFLLDKYKMLLLPRWNLTLLGQEYVVRHPLHRKFNGAWFMTVEDSKRMDKKIVDLLKLDKEEVGLAQIAVRDEMDEILKQKVVGVMKK